MVPMYGGQQSLPRWSGSARNSSGRQHLSKQSSSSDLLERINCPQNRTSVAAGKLEDAEQMALEAEEEKFYRRGGRMMGHAKVIATPGQRPHSKQSDEVTNRSYVD